MIRAVAALALLAACSGGKRAEPRGRDAGAPPPALVMSSDPELRARAQACAEGAVSAIDIARGVVTSFERLACPDLYRDETCRTAWKRIATWTYVEGGPTMPPLRDVAVACAAAYCPRMPPPLPAICTPDARQALERGERGSLALDELAELEARALAVDGYGSFEIQWVAPRLQTLRMNGIAVSVSEHAVRLERGDGMKRAVLYLSPTGVLDEDTHPVYDTGPWLRAHARSHDALVVVGQGDSRAAAFDLARRARGAGFDHVEIAATR